MRCNTRACIPFHFQRIVGLIEEILGKVARSTLPVPVSPEYRIQEASVKRTHLILFVAVTFACSSPAFAQRSSHPGGGPPAGHGPSSAPASGTGEANKTGAMSHTDMSHASPSDVLSHNTAIAGKIKKANKQAADDMKESGS